MSEFCEHNPLGLLMEVAERVHSFMESVATDLGLTLAQARVLAQLDEPRRIGDIAQQQTCDPSSATTMMHRLERDGLVRRVIDPKDARARLVQLTPKGRRRRTAFLSKIGDGGDVLDALPDNQRTALAALFGTPRSPKASSD
jgi:MarR family transcriptional regulator, organic hydroperoxide resistance regulator